MPEGVAEKIKKGGDPPETEHAEKSKASDTMKAGDPVAPCPKKKKKKVKVVKIKARILATRSLHPPKRRIREIKKLKSSSSSDESLDGNKPVVLVRGCNVLRLTAETSPPNQPVTWEVKPNENDNKEPTFNVEKGNTIKLDTGQTGSFSVIASIEDSKIVWNVVFVFVNVRVRTTRVTLTQTFLAPPTGQTVATAANSTVAAGQFVRGSNAMEATVKVVLIGGGADGKRGIDRIKLGYLQDGTDDTLTGNYDAPPGGGTAREVVHALPKTNPVTPATFPIIDAQGPPAGADEPEVPAEEGGVMSPVSFTDARIVQVKAKGSAGGKGKSFEFYFGDSPVGSFPRTHPNTNASLTSIAGRNAFRAAVASVSKDAPQQITAHAEISWEESYAGAVAPPPAATAAFTPAAGDHVIPASRRFKLISPPTGGTDAFDAGFETFAPRFNFSLETVFNP